MHVLTALIVAFVLTEVAILVTSVYLHRGLAHKALTVHPAVGFVCRTMLWLSTGMRPREWVAVHRRHHASTDTADDPHSPLVYGFWKVQLANAALYRHVARDKVTVDRYARDLPPTPADKLLFDHAFLGLGIGITLLCLVFGWQTGLLAAVLHAVMYLNVSGAVNAVGHTYGRRPYANSGTNSQLLALVSGGEGFHNNHHAAPTSARFSLQPHQLDVGWVTIRGLSALHLATVRHDEVKLAPGS